METNSKIEKYFLDKTNKTFFSLEHERVPVITVDNYIALGKLVALRFIKWIYEHPEGVVSLPTGKTPEYFIKWFINFKNNFNKKEIKSLFEETGLTFNKFPFESYEKLKEVLKGYTD